MLPTALRYHRHSLEFIKLLVRAANINARLGRRVESCRGELRMERHVDISRSISLKLEWLTTLFSKIWEPHRHGLGGLNGNQKKWRITAKVDKIR